MQPDILLSGSPPSKPLRSLNRATRFIMSARETLIFGKVSIAPLPSIRLFCPRGAPNGAGWAGGRNSPAKSCTDGEELQCSDASRPLDPIGARIMNGSRPITRHAPRRRGTQYAVCQADGGKAVPLTKFSVYGSARLRGR